MTNMWGGLSSNQMQILSDTKQYSESIKQKIANGEIPPTGTVSTESESSGSEGSGLENQSMMQLMMMLMMSQMMSNFSGQNNQQPPQYYQPPVFEPMAWLQSIFSGWY